MPLAIVNKETNIVENLIVPPEGANAWFVPEGYEAVMTEIGQIGDRYENGEFIQESPDVAAEAPEGA